MIDVNITLFDDIITVIIIIITIIFTIIIIDFFEVLILLTALGDGCRIEAAEKNQDATSAGVGRRA